MLDPAGQDDEDRALIACIARGDRAAFETFYGRFARRVYAFALTVVGEPDIAEQITGDTLFEVWRSAKRYRGRARASTWVFAIAHHRALDAVRRRRVPAVPLEAAPHPAVWDAPGTESDLGAGDESLEAALATLSPDHRVVLDLTFAFGCTQSEIAAIVKAPVATVKTRIFHAKRRLREALGRIPARKDAS